MSERATQPQGRVEAARPLMQLVDQGVLLPSQKVLCYGCGRGADLAWLKRRGFKAVGYDPHPPFGYSELPQTKFDFVVLTYLMARLKTEEQRRNALRKAWAYVRPGGHVLLIARSWARLAQGADSPTPEHALAYLNALLSGQDAGDPVCHEQEPGEPTLCVSWRKPGVYQPTKPVEWVTDAAGMAFLYGALAQEPRIALDVETTLEEPRALCTIQLGAPTKTWVVDALAFEDLTSIKALMEDPGIEILIHNASFEEHMLGKHGIRINNIYDTLPTSRKKYKGVNIEGGHKLGEVCERELGIYMDKRLQISDWTQRPLSPEQMNYAAVDAEVLLDLYEVFNPPPPPENLELFSE
jgi:hypothetical protein